MDLACFVNKRYCFLLQINSPFWPCDSPNELTIPFRWGYHPVTGGSTNTHPFRKYYIPGIGANSFPVLALTDSFWQYSEKTKLAKFRKSRVRMVTLSEKKNRNSLPNLQVELKLRECLLFRFEKLSKLPKIDTNNHPFEDRRWFLPYQVFGKQCFRSDAMIWNTFRRKVDPNLTFQMSSNRQQQALRTQQQQQQPLGRSATDNQQKFNTTLWRLTYSILTIDRITIVRPHFRQRNPESKLNHSLTVITAKSLGRFNFSEHENQTTNQTAKPFWSAKQFRRQVSVNSFNECVLNGKTKFALTSYYSVGLCYVYRLSFIVTVYNRP